MDLNLIIGIVVFVLISAVIIKLVGKLVKSFMIIGVLLAIIAGSFVFLIYKDAMDFKENFPEGEKLFLLKEDGSYIAGFQGRLVEDDMPEGLSEETLESYKDKPYSSIIEDNYKLFVIDMSFFDNVEDVTVDEDEVSAQKFIDLLESATPIKDYIEDNAPELPDEMKKQQITQLKEQYGDHAAFKGLMFATLFGEAMKEDPVSIFEGYKQGQVDIYEETIMFKMFNYVPKSILDKAVQVS